MGIWDFYFIAKLFLYFGHYIGFHVIENLLFAACLLIPLQYPRLRLARQILAAPVGIALLYYDSWLPPLSRLFSAVPELAQFDLVYLGELLGRVFSLYVVGGLILLFGLYILARKRLRISTFVLLAMLIPLFKLAPSTPDAPDTSATIGTAGTQGQPGVAELNAALNNFYQMESSRSVSFTPPAQADRPFDIIFLQICSLSHDDLVATKEQDNPLFKRFDILFTRFNSAATYSGPAVIRLLRGSCGHARHSTLYDPVSAQCETFNNLQRVGFETQFAMNHDGDYGNFLADVRERGGLQAKPFTARHVAPYLQSFDGSPVHDDFSVLSQWWNQRLKLPAQRVALYYNSISLHDGNRYSGKPNTSSLEIFQPRLTRLLADMDHFFDTLEKSGRRAIVVFIPEHGAAVRGDKMQIAGLREIPSPRITEVPVGIKLIGLSKRPAGSPLVFDQPASYLSVSQLLSEFITLTPFGEHSLALSEYLKDLPTTQFVAENEDVVVMQHGTQYFIRAMDAAWVEYSPTD